MRSPAAGQDLLRVHRDGLLRGLLFAAALALPIGLTAASTPPGPAKVAAPAQTPLRAPHPFPS